MMSEAVEAPKNQVPRLTNRLSASINILQEEIEGLDEDLSDFRHDTTGVEEDESNEPSPSLCPAADYLRDRARLIDDASGKIQRLMKCIQI